jgi:opacity protein-like surface antigen
MRWFGNFVAASVCGLAMTATVHAADMPGGWLPDLKKQFYTDLISGWYVRADLGYRTYNIGSVDAPTVNAVIGSDIDNAWTAGFGGGYKYKWFRSDVTFDYANKARFHGETAQGPGYYTTQVDSFTVLANVYFDLGTWAGFTPYIGAGVGGTNMRTHEFRIAGQIPSEGIADTTRWNLSWMLIDVGYRYIQLGETISGTLPPSAPDPVVNTARLSLRDMSAQEIRIGLRWMLD